MRQRRLFERPYGLKSRFIWNLLVSGILCFVLFCVCYSASSHFLTSYFRQSNFFESHVKRQGSSLQKYVDNNDISSTDLDKLKKWEYRQPVILLELYSKDKCIYSSIYDVAMNSVINDSQKENIVEIKLADKTVTAVMYSDFTYQYYVLGVAVSFFAAVSVFVMLFLRSNRRLIRYIIRLNEEVQILEGGNLEYEVLVEGNDEITDLARSMNRMRKSFQQQMETEQELHQANRRLITEMSHDLRTPLTGIMLYLEILRSRNYATEEELQEYLRKIDAKAHHLKILSDHLFEYSMKESPKKQQEPLEMREAFDEALKSLVEDLKVQGFEVSTDLQWKQSFVQVEQEFIHRIIENISSNILKYAIPRTEVLISSIDVGQYYGFSVLNSCNPIEECSQNIESNGIGIESIRNLMSKMGGICTVEQAENVFEITLLFPEK